MFNLVRTNVSKTLSFSIRCFSDRTIDLFQLAKATIPNLPAEPSNEQKLQLYALFKQAESGKGPASARPGFLDPIGRAKYDAWDTLKSLDKEAAMKQYTELVRQLNGGKLAQPTTTSSSTGSESASNNIKTVTTLESISFPRQAGTVLSQKFETILTSMTVTGVLTVRLNRPSRGNSLNMAMWNDLNLLFDAIKRDNGVRAVILTGSENSFCTGMDLSVFLDMQKLAAKEPCEARKRESLSSIIEYLQQSISLAEKCHVPVIAAVSGFCIGGAVDLITACDLRLCTKSADFSVKEVDLAIVADIGTLQRLPKLVGEQHARDLCYTGRHFSGKEAFAMGLVLLPPFETEAEMLAVAHEKAELIASKSPVTMRGIKASLNFSRDHSVSESLNHVKMHNAAYLYSTDLLEAMTQASSKSKKFTGK